MGCFKVILAAVGFVLVMITFIRWFEQTAEAVDNGWWNKLVLLLICPFVVWFFPSRVGVGRLNPVPRHEPVRGFGSLPKPNSTVRPHAGTESGSSTSSTSVSEPPPGTPREFMEMPAIPPARPRSSPDPEQLAKLREKMRQQGMLPPEGQ
jgi:hypothetical protein